MLRQFCPIKMFFLQYVTVGPDSLHRIATSYRLHVPRIVFQWGARISAPVQTGPGTDPVSIEWVPGLFFWAKTAEAW